MRERLKNMPVPVVATMLGAATLSNVRSEERRVGKEC